ncbi:uncharacterized protein BX664DRAFT_337954 [Halteromyces radiatus]|uniref:uncharacterized protein n=1 Tax=Halteromyces radiatus TaxID=101107 RepID=UPI00221EF3FA|nr:uncharacterized protein BX664DRAFT_337954 [Halteromyces radiatus]KAI8084859.1 hypothetical protein BX664DRAFT_337954 [Halteromyces radiatus]
MDLASQSSQTEPTHIIDTEAILQRLEPFLNKIHQYSIPHDSQNIDPIPDRSSLFQEFLCLSFDEVKTACEHIDFTNWTDDALADMYDTFGSMDNLGHLVACTVVQSSLYPYVIRLKTSLSRLLMNSVLQLGKVHGNVILNGLIFPLLNTTENNKEVGQSQMELISKLITNSLSPSSRLTLLKFMIAGNSSIGLTRHNIKGIISDYPMLSSSTTTTVPSDTIMQLLNIISSSQPLISLDTMTIRQLIQTSHQVVQARPKDKACMQLLLTLTSKHAQSLVDANILDDLEAVCNESNMFLKRSVLGQIASIRKKTQDSPSGLL